jgi:LysM repeat protein
MKRLILPVLLMGGFVWAKSTNGSLKSILLKHEKSINVNLKSVGNSSYVVKEGDDLESIACDHHITLGQLKEANRLTAKSTVHTGATLLIPDQTIRLSDLLISVNNIGPLLTEAKEHLGKKYVWGAVGPTQFDCSGFTSYVCKKNQISIPRTSIMQGEVGKKIARGELKEGDLIFFDTSKEHNGVINHVGIYAGDNKFIHASSATMSVVISSLDQNFYKSRFMWGQRVAKDAYFASNANR